MRFLSLSSFLIACTITATSIHAEDREIDLVRAMLRAANRAQLDEVSAKARKSEVHPQIITESRLLFALRTQDTPFLVSMIPELDSAALKFNPQQSTAGLSSADQLRGLIAYVRALDCMERKDDEGFREHINDALWLCPQQAGLFGQAVEQYQLRDKMSKWSVDFSTTLLEAGASETTLSHALGRQKAILLVFWSDGSSGSLSALPVIGKMAATAAQHGIAVAFVNIDRSDAEEKTKRVQAEMKIALPWLIEPETRPLVSLFEIGDTPRAVLITQQGRVTFHGHPLEPNLGRALKRLAPALNLPQP